MLPTVLIATAFGVIAFDALGGGPRRDVRAARTLARRVDLALPAALEPAVAQRLATRRRASGSLMLAGVVLACAVLLVVPALLMVAYEVAAARLLERPQVAATTLELAWDDALRSRTLRDLLGAALLAGLGLPLALLSVTGQGLEGGWPANPAVGVVAGGVGLLLGGAVLAGATSLALQPHRHFRARLWPRTTEGAAR